MIKINILQTKTLNQFIHLFTDTFIELSYIDIIKNLMDNHLNYINKNLSNINLHKLIYIKIQNKIPAKLARLVMDNYDLEVDELKLLDQIHRYNFNFENYDFNDKILHTINNIIFSLKQNNLQYLKTNYDFDSILKKEKQLINEINNNTYVIMKGHIEDLQKLALENNINNLQQLMTFVNNNKEYFLQNYSKEIIGFIIPYKFCKKYNYSLQDARLFASYLYQSLDIISYIKTALKKLDQNQLFSKFIDDPWNFINFKDNTSNNSIVYSTRSAYDFSSDRSGPLIIIENSVLPGNNDDLPHHEDILRKYRKDHGISDEGEAAYTEGYKNYKNVGVGSQFNTVALLEFIQGNAEIIKQALIKEGFEKIYVNNQSAWTSKEYKRIAQKQSRKDIFKKNNFCPREELKNNINRRLFIKI